MVPLQNARFTVVLGTLLNGTQVAVRVPAEGFATGDFIRALEASTGQANVFWLVLWGSKVLARAADKYSSHTTLIDKRPTEGLTFLKHQHNLTDRADLLCGRRIDVRLAEQNTEYHAVFLAAFVKSWPVMEAMTCYKECFSEPPSGWLCKISIASTSRTVRD